MIGVGFAPSGNQPVPKWDPERFQQKKQQALGAGAPAASGPGPGVSPGRAKLVQSILDATGSGQQEVNHPLQAIGNATNQMAQAYLKRKTSGGPSPWNMGQSKFQQMQRQKLNIKTK